MTPPKAPSDLYDAAALWSCRLGAAQDVVMAACDALAAGLDGPSLGMLAALTAREADVKVPALLPMVLAELGLPALVRDSDAARAAALSALAAQLLAGRRTPAELANAVHLAFGHGLPLVERLAELDDEYDIIEYSGRTADEIDADIIAEAHRLAAGRSVLTDSGAAR